MADEIIMADETIPANGPQPIHIAVPKAQLEILINRSKELTQLRSDLENDIGWISRAIDNIINSPNPLKLVPKIIMGKINMKELGLDDERLESISSKYAPKAHAEIQAKKTK